jgi:hypothetical protein
MNRRAPWLPFLPLAVLAARSAWLGRARPELLREPAPQRDVAPPRETARVWITDGSLPVFSDTTYLETSHRVPPGISTRYEGFVDPGVARGLLEVARERAGDALFVEVEWCVELRDGAVVLQGFLEGKWMNRLLGTHAWKPASMANNVLAVGPGIETTLDELERGLDCEARVEYESVGAGRRMHVTHGADLRGHAVAALVREVLALGEPLDAVNLGALGTASAVVNEKERVLTAALPLPRPHRAKERLVWRALADGLAIKPGEAASLVVRDGAGAVVGEATLALAG